MKGGNYVIRNCTSKTFDVGHNVYTREKLALMNEKWKSQAIISFSIYNKVNMNEFIDYHLWVKYVLDTRLLISIIQLSMVKTEQQRQILFDKLYNNEFPKSNVEHLFMLKSKEDLQHQIMTKPEFLALIKPILATKVKLKKN